MPLFGTLSTMPLTDLLQWVASARLSGTLQIERNKVSKSIVFHEGQVIGCSSDDPPERLGQFLIARGKISEEQLCHALGIQESTRKHLGMTLVEMGAMTPDELSSHLEAKAEETIFSIFGWEDAVFRFQQGVKDEANVFPICLRVEDVLLRGLKRYDEIQRIREVFPDPRLVLCRTTKPPPQAVLDNPMARTLFEAIDGERTVEEISLHVHGSEYVVTKFLFELYQNGFLKISGTKKIEEPEPPAPAPAANDSGETIDAATMGSDLPDFDLVFADDDPQRAVDQPMAHESSATATPPSSPEPPAAPHVAEPNAVAGTPVAATTPPEPPDALGDVEMAGSLETIDKSEAYQLAQQLERARIHMRQGEYLAALEILDRLYRAHPSDESLRRLTCEAEAAFIEKAYRHFLPQTKIPRLTRPVEQLAADAVSPTEFFLLSRIDGNWDIKSIVQIAPLREADTLRALKRMREEGIVELVDPD